MKVKVGEKFVAVTKAPELSGTPVVGEKLTVVAPETFQSAVTP